MDETLLELLYSALLLIAARVLRSKCPGRPPKLGLTETAFLAVVREHRRMTYRELASSRYVRWLGLRVHYTAIQKATTRLPEWFLNEATRVFAEFVSPPGGMFIHAPAIPWSAEAFKEGKVIHPMS